MGKKHLVAGATYDTTITAEFDICKNPCNGYENFYVTADEEREIMRWLNRREMLPFRLLSEDYENIIFNGSFNVEKVESGGHIFGFHLKFTSDRPFGYLENHFKFKIGAANGKKTIYDDSDEIGISYPRITLILDDSGDLIITNSFDGRQTKVANCVSGEVITFDNMWLTSSDSAHNKTIMNDFNFMFPQICNSYSDRKNTYTFSLPCSVEFYYEATRKVGV